MELVLRSWTEDDAPALSRAIAASVEHLRPWMAWAADEPHDDLWRRQLIRGWRQEAAAGGDETFGMWLGDQVVGACGLHRRIGPGGLEIGYWVHAAFTRQGLATEAARRLRDDALARPGIDHVEIHHDRANVASGRVAAAAGFTLVGERSRSRDAPAQEGVELQWRVSGRPADGASAPPAAPR